MDHMKYINRKMMVNWNSMSRIILAFAIFSIFIPSEVSATHIVGGDITYRCLGNEMYEIRMIMRRDCLLGADDAPFDNPAAIGFYDAVTNQLIPIGSVSGYLQMFLNNDDTLNQTFISDCTIAGNDVCVEQTVYVDTVRLPFRSNGYIMAYQRCCRNGTLANIVDPLNTGMTLIALLSGQAQQSCDNSPQFGEYPPIYICANNPIEFDHSASDGDGDSLVYSLCTPYAGGDIIDNMPQPPPSPPYDPVVWQSPFGLDNVLGGTPLNIDPLTGMITGTPNAVGQYIVGICVKAYREGILIGETRRDFQYNVRMCRDVPVADYTAPELECEGLTISFENNSINSDEYLWVFDWGNPDSETSTQISPTYTFPAPGFYDVALIVNDIDLICFDTLIQTIGVFESELESDFILNASSCVEEIVLTPIDISSDPTYEIVSWNWILTCGFDIQFSVDQSPTFNIVGDPDNCNLCLTVTDENGCTAMSCQSFDPKIIDIELLSDNLLVCNGESTPLVANPNPEFDYTWSPLTDLDITNPSNPISTPSAPITYYVTITDGICEVLDSISIDIQQRASLEFDVFNDCKSLTITTDNQSEGNLFFWDFGDVQIDADTSNEVSPTYTYNQPGIYSVTLFSRDGCDTMATKEITVAAIDDTIEDIVLGCENVPVSLNPGFNINYSYQWEPAGLLDDPNAGNPEATVETETTFYVTITDNAFPQCMITDSITVELPMVNITDMLADTVISCFMEPVTLNDDFNARYTYEWAPQEGLSDPMAGNPVATVNMSTMFFVTITDNVPPNCTIEDSILVFVPDDFQIILPPDTAYCDVQTINITASSDVEGVTYEWFDQDGNSIGTGASIDLTPGEPSAYMVTGTDPYGCSKSGSIILTPTFFDLEFGDDQGICLGDVVELSVTNLDPTQELCYTWTPVTGMLTSPDSNIVLVSPEVTTAYTVLVENKTVGCSVEMTFTVTVFNFDPLEVTITADKDSVIVGDDVQLTVNQDPSWTYEWTSNPVDEVANVYNPVVSPPTEGGYTYMVTVTNDGGCTAVASISVNSFDPKCNDEDIFLPNAFTPNNDGENDVLFVRGNFVLDMELHIYNRWGQEVFSSTDQSNGWDGTFNGAELTPDVYGYYLNIGCPNEKSFFKKGNITLLR